MRVTRTVRLAAVLAVALLASGCTAFFDYHRLRVLRAQETAWHEDGDELRLATVTFRSKPGVPGSTQVYFDNASTDRVASDLDTGDVRIISNARGLYTFDDLEVVTAQGLLQGQVPEIFGQLVVGIEDDGTPVGTVRDIMRDIEAELRVQLQQIIEPMTVADILANPAALSDRFAQAAEDIEAAATPNFLGKIKILLSSFFNPDDFIDFNFMFFVPVGPDLAPIVDDAFSDLPDGIHGGALPTEVLGGTIPPKVFELDFQDHETHYRVTTYVGAGSEGISPTTVTTQPPFNPCDPDPPPPPGGHCR